jgi:hypothetical protein
MDRNTSAMIVEIIRAGLGFLFLVQQQDWFGASVYFPGVQYVLGTYFIISLLGTGWFVVKHRREDAIGSELEFKV